MASASSHSGGGGGGAKDSGKMMTAKDFARNSAAFKKNNDNTVHVLNEFDMALKQLEDDIKGAFTH
jgi:hypothetical protein